MRLIVDKHNKKSILFKNRIMVDYKIGAVEQKKDNLEILCIELEKNTNCSNFLLQYDENTEFYLIENMLLINFGNEIDHYCLYKLPPEYINYIIENKNINIIITENENIEYYLFFDKIIGL